MSIYIAYEPEYLESTWCSEIIRGISDAAKKKRTEVFFANECQEGKLPGDGDMLAVCATNPYWISNYIIGNRKNTGTHIVLVGNTPLGLEVSNVCIDIGHAIGSVLSYLRNDCNKKSTALYGVNPTSVNDLAKLSAFSAEGKAYFNRGDLLACYNDFLKDAEEYDSVICTNDYAAISLIRLLKSDAPSLIERLYIVSFADTALASQCTPSVTSVSMDFYQCGTTAVEVFSQLKKNPPFSCINVSMKSKIIPRDTTECTPCSESSLSYTPKAGGSVTDFYGDKEVIPLLTLERLFNACDSTDLAILWLIADNCSYEDIAGKLFMSVNGIKYRLKRLSGICGVSGKKDIAMLLKKHFSI